MSITQGMIVTSVLFIAIYIWCWWMIRRWAQEARSQDLRERITRYCE